MVIIDIQINVPRIVLKTFFIVPPQSLVRKIFSGVYIIFNTSTNIFAKSLLFLIEFMLLSNMWEKAEKELSKDKYIAPLIREWGSCTIKPLKKELYFEDLVDAICSQQLSGKAAKTIFCRVKELLGEINPQKISLIDEQKLRDCGLSWAKVKYVKDLSDKVLSGDLDLHSLNNLDDESVIASLTKVKGIGRWTAEMFLMFSLARPDVFPIDDLGIKKGFEKVIGRTWDKVESAKFAAKRWKLYRTIACWYLWRSLDNR